jgi:hypothetical protein
MKYGHPGNTELGAIHSKLCKEIPDEESETETEELRDERWEVAELMMAHTPKTIADLGWQAEAFLVANLEMISSRAACPADRMTRQVFPTHTDAGSTAATK